jgi:hypothetical protein
MHDVTIRSFLNHDVQWWSRGGHMSLAVQAFQELYGHTPAQDVTLSYHGNLKGFNATVRKTPREIIFRLSPKLADCEPEIQIGVMQYLLNRINKTTIKSDHIDLYHSFLKKMSDLAPVTKTDPVLEASFARVNERYFDGLMHQPNLVWGRQSMALLGTYTYATDTVMLSRVLADDDHLIDYVMHHELLHKKHKFNHTGNRTHSHTKAFRGDEAKFEDKFAEERLKMHLARKRKQIRIDERHARGNFLQRMMAMVQ